MGVIGTALGEDIESPQGLRQVTQPHRRDHPRQLTHLRPTGGLAVGRLPCRSTDQAAVVLPAGQIDGPSRHRPGPQLGQEHLRQTLQPVPLPRDHHRDHRVVVESRSEQTSHLRQVRLLPLDDGNGHSVSPRWLWFW